MKTINFGSDRANNYVPVPRLVQLPSHLPSAVPVVCQQLHSPFEPSLLQPDDLQHLLITTHYKVLSVIRVFVNLICKSNNTIPNYV